MMIENFAELLKEDNKKHINTKGEQYDIRDITFEFDHIGHNFGGKYKITFKTGPDFGILPKCNWLGLFLGESHWKVGELKNLSVSIREGAPTEPSYLAVILTFNSLEQLEDYASSD